MSAKVSVRPRYKKVLKGYEENAKKIVGYGLQEIRGIAVKGILAGNKSGRATKIIFIYPISKANKALEL